MEDKPDATWIIPSTLTSSQLQEHHTTIARYLENIWTDAEGRDPEDLLRRVKTTTTAYAEDDEPRRDAFIDDSEGSDDLEDFMFPDNVRSKDGALDQLKLKHKKRKLMWKKSKKDDNPESSEVLDDRRKAREQAALDRRKKIKSDLYIRDSDEEMDEEENRAFFAREEENRIRQAQRVLAALSVGMTEEGQAKKRKSEVGGDSGEREEGKDKRRRSESEDEVMDEDEMEMMEMESATSQQQRAATSDDELDIEDTPLSSQSQPLDAHSPQDGALKEIPQPRLDSSAASKGQEAEGSDDGDAPVMASQRRRGRAGFVLDDSDEE